MYRKTLTAATLASVLLLAPAAAASASGTGTSAEPSLTYSVNPVFPDNQDENIKGYYSLSTDKDTLDQNLTVQVTNTAEVSQTITVETMNAYTSANGVIQYTSEKPIASSILDANYELNKHISVSDDQITLAPDETRDVILDLDIEGVEGTILGGVAFSTLSDEEEVKEGINIINKVNTIVGIAANLPGDNEGKLSTGDAHINPMPSYYTVNLPLKFDVAHVSTGGMVKYAVTENGNEVFKGEQKLDFAPKTSTDYAMPFEGETIKEDIPYTISGEVVYDHYGQQKVVPFSSEFRYVPESDDPQMKDPASKDFKKPEVISADEDEDSNVLMWSVIGGLVLALILALVALFKRKKDQGKSTTKKH